MCDNIKTKSYKNETGYEASLTAWLKGLKLNVSLEREHIVLDNLLVRFFVIEL